MNSIELTIDISRMRQIYRLRTDPCNEDLLSSVGQAERGTKTDWQFRYTVRPWTSRPREELPGSLIRCCSEIESTASGAELHHKSPAAREQCQLRDCPRIR